MHVLILLVLAQVLMNNGYGGDVTSLHGTYDKMAQIHALNPILSKSLSLVHNRRRTCEYSIFSMTTFPNSRARLAEEAGKHYEPSNCRQYLTLTSEYTCCKVQISCSELDGIRLSATNFGDEWSFHKSRITNINKQKFSALGRGFRAH